MTREERNTKLKAFITCLKCEVSGKSCDDNCPTQYEAGNMREIIENLEAISKIIEQESVIDKIRAEIKGMTPTYHNPDWSITDLVPISEVLKLVDKYKAESEAEK